MSNHYIKGQNYCIFFLIFQDNEKSRQIVEKQITWRFGSSTVPPWQMVKSAPWVSDIFFPWFILLVSDNLSFKLLKFEKFGLSLWLLASVFEMWTVESAKFYAPYFAVFQHDFFPPAGYRRPNMNLYTTNVPYEVCLKNCCFVTYNLGSLLWKNP